MINCLKRYLFLLPIIFYSQNIFSQTNTITGNVSDSLNKAVPYCIILFKDSINAPPKKYCIADKNGNYKLELNGKITKGVLEFKSLNYKPLIKSFGFYSNTEIHIDVKLNANETNLPAVIVKSNGAITINGDTTQFKVQSFKTGNEKNVGDLLNNMPGFVVQDNGKVAFNGKMINKILIDGDDITGKNYEVITKNLNTEGMEDIQVIKNYKDPENIVSSYNDHSDITVLNLRYKKGFVEKIFGESDIATNLLSRYDVKLQATSLMKKIKALSFQKINNAGDDYSNSNNQINNSLYIDQSTNSLTEISTSNQSINSTISSIQDVIAPKGINSITGNNSFLSSVSFFSRINSKTILKGRTEEVDDKYSSYLNSITTYLPPYPDITISNSEDVSKHYKQVFNSLSLNYSDKKNQFGIIADYKNDNNRYNGSGVLYPVNYEESLSEKKSLYNVKLVYARIFDKTSYSTFDIQYTTQSVNGNYNITPGFFDSFFFKNSAYNFIEQTDRQSFSALLTNFRYFKKIKRYSLDCYLSYNISNNKLSNNIYSGVNELSKVAFNQDSTNSYNFSINNFSLKIDNGFTVNNNLKFNFGITGIQYTYNYQNVFPLHNSIAKILPFVSATFRINNNDQLYLNSFLQNNIPNLNNLGYGYEIKNLSTIQKGVDSVAFLNSYNVTIGFGHVDFIKNRMIYFLNFSINSNPMYYIGNPNVGQAYTYYNYSVTNKILRNYIITSSLQKFTNNMKYKFSYFLSYLTGNSYSIYSGSDIKSLNNYFENSFQIQIKPCDKLSLKLESNYAINTQKIDMDSQNKFTFKRWGNKINVTYLFTGNINYSFDGNYLTFYSLNNKSSNSLIINSSINFDLKNSKISFGFSVNNLLNSLSFLQTNFSPVSAIAKQINLFPRVVLGYMKINF